MKRAYKHLKYIGITLLASFFIFSFFIITSPIWLDFIEDTAFDFRDQEKRYARKIHSFINTHYKQKWGIESEFKIFDINEEKNSIINNKENFKEKYFTVKVEYKEVNLFSENTKKVFIHHLRYYKHKRGSLSNEKVNIISSKDVTKFSKKAIKLYTRGISAANSGKFISLAMPASDFLPSLAESTIGNVFLKEGETRPIQASDINLIDHFVDLTVDTFSVDKEKLLKRCEKELGKTLKREEIYSINKRTCEIEYK